MKTYVIIINGRNYTEFSNSMRIQDVKKEFLNLFKQLRFQCGYSQQDKFILCFEDKDKVKTSPYTGSTYLKEE